MEAKEVQDISALKIKDLHELYVWATEQASRNPEVNLKAREFLTEMEKGNRVILDRWQKIKELSISEYERTSRRINVHFDHYHGESMYTDEDAILADMTKAGILHPDDQGRKVYHSPDRPVTIVKSDGSSLYILRDIRAAIERHAAFRFGSMYYVVDNDQSIHFSNLRSILRDLGYDWADRIHHIGFGKIKGMSSRKGNAVDLKELLDSAKQLMVKNQEQSKSEFSQKLFIFFIDNLGRVSSVSNSVTP